MSTAFQAVWLVCVGLLSLQAAEAGYLAQNGYHERWVRARGTWYGDPYGEGSSGGNCGYTKLWGTPIGPKIVAGSRSIYANGQGCGQCYQIRCVDPNGGPRLCNPQGTNVVVTDFCPGGTYCSTGENAFDMSGAAINAMALRGREGQLRNRGLYNLLYKRVPCRYRGTNIEFRVDNGSSPFWLSILIKYVGGPGDIGQVYIRMANWYKFQPMRHAWGANWMIPNYDGKPFRGPMDIRIVSRLNRHTVLARGVIPAYFRPGTSYRSRVQMAF
ncbi:expansin-B3 [Physcomitrium patens]|uniref:Beta-expansin 2 n=1 Tax=Physcomitrium patens TaxID=3218 RepID=Q84V41_PHYPA|nr:expansin-B3-like [Physcomitrium patens]AAL71872.1 beta-expansin 2 [Physcomitrium patens]PNR63334.1 hypothetical protein PHYPA_001759 [Physcomitrium patens]|eukprot:XP_024364231.1 expansin-B3-like [Physcomitrella patens]